MTAGKAGRTTAAAVRWSAEPAEHDYPAAGTYLSLLAEDGDVAKLVKALRKTAATHFKAKDILRAAGLPLLPADNVHVASDLRKIADGTPLSPVLLVRGDLRAGHRLQIADGYHRVCASYLTDENTDIPCRMATLDTGR